MSIAYVNSGALFNAASGTTTPFTTGWSPTPGNTLIVVAYHQGTSDLTCSDGEGTGNVYTADADLGFVGNIRIKVFRCTNWQGSGACTITINNSTNEFCSIIVAEYSGLHASPVDATPVTAQGTANNPTAGSITTVANDCLIVAGFGDITGTNGTITGNGSYNLRQSNGNGATNFVGAMQDRIVSSPTTSADGFTYSHTDHWVAVQVSYKAAAAGAGTSDQAAQSTAVTASESISATVTTDQTLQSAQAFGRSDHTNQTDAATGAVSYLATGATDQPSQQTAATGDGGDIEIDGTGATDQAPQEIAGTGNVEGVQVPTAGGSAGRPSRKRPRSVPLSPRFRLPDRFPDLTPPVVAIVGTGSTTQPAQGIVARAALDLAARVVTTQGNQNVAASGEHFDQELETLAIMLAEAA